MQDIKFVLNECFTRKGMHFLHLNSRSLLPKISEIRLLAEKSRAAVIAITETWLDNTISDSEVSIDGYSLIRKDRNRNGGGVCIYIMNRYAFNRREDISSSEDELLWAEIHLPKSRPIVVGVCYRPPKQSDFCARLEETLSKIRSDCETIVLGDMNICFTHKSSQLFKMYNNVLQLFNFEQIIDTPTRISCNSSTVIDHILSNVKENILQCGTISVGISDHLLTFCTRKISRGHFKSHNTIKIRSMKNYCAEGFIELLRNTDWSKCFNSTCVNTSWKSFKEIFVNILDDVCPVKEIRLKQRTEAWMTTEIYEMIKSRDEFLYKFKKHGSQSDYKEFCKFRNRIQREIKLAKSNYFSNKIEENRNNPRKLWQQLKELGYKNKGNEGAKIILKINDEICHDSRTIADHFNEFFTTVATNLVSKLPKAIYKFSVDSHLFKEFYSSRNTTNSHMTLKPVSEDFIYKELLKLNPTKSTGLDEIPARFIRDGACILKVPICYIVNQSIFSGIVPDDMKVARVKPLYKKNSPLEVGNYRPVSILSIVSKILERSVYSQLSEFLDSNNLLFEYQSGFRSKFSTDTCLIHLLDYIKGNSAKGLFTGMIMLDLQKAFDTVDHDILCDKLKVMGVESVNWFRSYLSDRKQFVCINEVSSKSGHVSCGVPQGSILGPLLFLIYVNDMSMSIDNDCKLILYADDSAILFPHKNPDVISNKLGKVLESCSSWLVDNKLSLHLHTSKSVYAGILISSNIYGCF